MSDDVVEALVQAVKRVQREADVAVRLCPVAYVVTQGEYADYRIKGVFLDKALADAFATELREEDTWREPVKVAEWSLDPLAQGPLGPAEEPAAPRSKPACAGCGHDLCGGCDG